MFERERQRATHTIKGNAAFATRVGDGAVYGVSTKTFLAKLKQELIEGGVTRPPSADDDAKTLERVASDAGVVGDRGQVPAGPDPRPPDRVSTRLRAMRSSRVLSRLRRESQQ